MIQDVIESRKKALAVKESELKKGRKVSFHSLWASEFKKIYPNSSFTSNNLSVHFWTWRKQQQKTASKKVKNDVSSPQSFSAPASNVRSDPLAGHVWNRAAKIRLLEVGKKVEEMMRDQGTPNEVKVTGFANMLWEEWKKANPDRELDSKTESARCLNLTYSKVGKDGPGQDDDEFGGYEKPGWTTSSKLLLLKVGQRVEEMLQNPTTPNEIKLEGFGSLLQSEWKKLDHPNGSGSETSRSLSMMYTKLQKEGLIAEEPNEDSEPKVIMATWTPKHNRVLQDCMEKFADLAAVDGLSSYRSCVIKSWRAKFSKSSISDAMLWRKMNDLSLSDVSQLHNLVKGEPELIDLDDINVKKEPSVATSSTSDKGQMVWNTRAIRDMFEVHRKAKEELSSIKSTKCRPQLSNLVHSNFVRLHPNCQLAPSILMAKLFSYKTSQSKGLLDIKPTQKETTVEIQQTVETNVPPKVKAESSAKSKNLVFRTWTQTMIDDMMSTRKMALIKKKKRLEADPTDALPMAEIWYEEFMKLQPDYKSTKKNLWRKYKWYKSRMGQASVDKKEGSSPRKEDRKENIFSKIEDSKLEEQLSPSNPVIRMKSIRKDVFNYIKAVLEEPRIFLPPKFSEPVPTTHDQFVTPPPLQSFVRPISTFRIAGSMMSPPQGGPFAVPPPLTVPVMTSAGVQTVRTTVSFIAAGPNQFIQTVAPMQHQQQSALSLGGPVMSIFPNGGPWQGLPPRQLTVMAVPQVQESGNNGNDSIKLPGGATLVAVTDRNADQLLKPKHLEKPHVTITIGDRQEGAGTSIKVDNPQQQQLQQQHQQQQQQQHIQQQQLSQHQSALMMSQQPPQTATLTAILHTPTQQIPLTIPYPINVPQYQPRPSVVQPPPLTQLRPQVPESPNQLSTRVRTRLAELNVPESMFGDLINMYSTTRDDFISTLKKGYLAFFPFMLGAEWREKCSGISNSVTGRKLASLMDLYSEDRRKGKIASPEYLTKVASNFSVTELMLKQLMVCHAETRNSMVSQLKMTVPLPIIYYEMCRRWPKIHPEVRMTTKQLISVHHMLSYEPGKDSTPEIDCQLAEIWKTMDKEVPLLATHESQKEIKRENFEDDDDDEAVYDDNNISMEQLQEWFLSTENLSGNLDSLRPRFVVRGTKWCRKDREDLKVFTKVVHRRWLDGLSRHRRLSQIDFLHRTWKRFSPKSVISKFHLTARCVREVRLAKEKRSKRENDQIRKWRLSCEEFCENEENTFVLDEVEEERRRQKQIEREELAQNKKSEVSSGGHVHAGFSGRLTSLSRHANLSVDNWKKDFNKDENVLAYIGAMQKTSSKGSQPITWTPEVIRDLMKARAEARKRKRIWEDWAVKKYGGVGIAYNLPNVKFTKVDDMFREEWIKVRPEMSNLSIWTLVSYARKFDNLKKQLIEANGGKVIKETNSKLANAEDKVRPLVAMLFFPESGIPKYNLDKLEKLKDIPQELKNLLKSRQMAKERQSDPENSRFTLVHFWEEAWCELEPESSMNGHELQRLLFRYEQNSLVRARLIPALLTKDDIETEPSSDSPQPQSDEILSVKPRNFVFPENEDEEDVSLFCYQTRPEPRGAVVRHFAHLDRDILRPNHPVFEIPIVNGVPVASSEKASKLRRSAKGYNLIEKTAVGHPELTFCHDEGKEKKIGYYERLYL